MNDAGSSIDFIHMDDDLLVANKPPGLLCVPGRGADKQDCLSERVRWHFADALVVHRLDMATSGLVLMARGSAMQKQLSLAFAAQQVTKHYEAVVQGDMRPQANAEPTGALHWHVIDLPIGFNWADRPKRRIDWEHGKPSRTRWRVLPCTGPAGSSGSNHTAVCTRLELAPLTGRTHQLRLHLQASGHAIVGDLLYGDATANDTRTARSTYPSNMTAPRMLLHATRLELRHPGTGKTLELHSAAPF